MYRLNATYGVLVPILYQCLTRKLPRLMKPAVDPIRILWDAELEPISDVLPIVANRVAHFIRKSLSPEAEDRYNDAGK